MVWSKLGGRCLIRNGNFGGKKGLRRVLRAPGKSTWIPAITSPVNTGMSVTSPTEHLFVCVCIYMCSCSSEAPAPKWFGDKWPGPPPNTAEYATIADEGARNQQFSEAQKTWQDKKAFFLDAADGSDTARYLDPKLDDLVPELAKGDVSHVHMGTHMYTCLHTHYYCQMGVALAGMLTLCTCMFSCAHVCIHRFTHIVVSDGRHALGEKGHLSNYEHSIQFFTAALIKTHKTHGDEVTALQTKYPEWRRKFTELANIQLIVEQYIEVIRRTDCVCAHVHTRQLWATTYAGHCNRGHGTR